MNDLPQSERQIGDHVEAGEDFEHGQVRDGRKGMRLELQCCRSSPGALQVHILQIILDQLADASGSVHMRDDLEQVIGGFERGLYSGCIGFFVLIPHCASHYAHRPVIELAQQRIRFHSQ